MAEIVNMLDWLRANVKPPHPIFQRHVCLRCDNGAKPCVRGVPNRCENPILVLRPNPKLPT